MSLQYIFVIHVYLGMYQSEVYELWIVRVVEAGSNIASVCGDDPSVHQSMSCNSLHVTTLPLFQPLIGFQCRLIKQATHSLAFHRLKSQ